MVKPNGSSFTICNIEVYEDTNLIEREVATAYESSSDYHLSVTSTATLHADRGADTYDALLTPNPIDYSPVNGIRNSNTVEIDDPVNHFIDFEFANTYAFSRVVIEGCKTEICPTDSELLVEVYNDGVSVHVCNEGARLVGNSHFNIECDYNFPGDTIRITQKGGTSTVIHTIAIMSRELDLHYPC